MRSTGINMIAVLVCVLSLLTPGFAAQPTVASLYDDIGDEDSAWINDLLNWRENVADWKHQVERGCFVNESDAYWTSLFECPDFSEIQCVNQTAWNSIKDTLNCTIVFCEDGRYSNNTVLRMISRDQSHMYKRIIAIYKEDLILCKQRVCTESTTETTVITHPPTTSDPLTTSAAAATTTTTIITTGYVSTACDGTEVVVSGTRGSISSPNYPSAYENSMICRWRIIAPNNTRIEVKFESLFEVEPGGSTGCYDYIAFTEVGKILCGVTAPLSFITPGNELSISFHTDGSVTEHGYSFNWTAIDINECSPGLDNNCDVNAECSNIDGSFICSCKTGYTGNGTECADIDECLDGLHNCDVNANCSNNDGSFNCSCKTGYSGKGTECMDCRQAIFDFPEMDHLNYVQYNGTLPRLESFTVCVWIHPASGDHAAKGDFLSYCTVGALNCNVLSVGIKTGRLEINVPNGNSYHVFAPSISPIEAATHLCIVLSNANASLQVYLNGTQPVQPFNTTAVIPSGGVLIIGQDQDNQIIGSSPGNPNQATDGFYGKMRGLLLWDRDFGESEIIDMYRSGCSCTNGAVVSFDPSNSRIKGNVTTNWEENCDEA